MHLASSPSSAVPQTSCAVPITSPVGRDRAILCGRGKRGTGPSARRRPLPDCANRGGFLHSESTCLLSGNNIANFSLPLVTALADERHWPRVACHSNLCIRSCPAGILCYFLCRLLVKKFCIQHATGPLTSRGANGGCSQLGGSGSGSSAGSNPVRMRKKHQSPAMAC